MDPSFGTDASVFSRHPVDDREQLLEKLILEKSTHSKPTNIDDATLSSRKNGLSIQIGGNEPGSDSLKLKRVSDEEDYDLLEPDPTTVLRGSRGGGLQLEPTLDRPSQFSSTNGMDSSYQSADDLTLPGPSQLQRRQGFSIKLEETSEKGKYTLRADDSELRDILRKGLQREAEAKVSKKRSRFRDLVFTRQFTAFDRQNTVSSPFRGFYTLFWLATFVMLVKIAATNWKVYGSVFGRNEILSMMFHRDVFVLGLTDGVMCASTVFCLLLQKIILAGYLSWNRHGWIIQNVGHGTLNSIPRLRGPQIMHRFLMSSIFIIIPYRKLRDSVTETQSNFRSTT